MPLMTIPVIPAILFGLATSLVITANVTFYLMLSEVNGKKDVGKQISPFFVNVRFSEIVTIHKRLFPKSRKRLLMYATAALGFGVGFVAFLFWSKG